MARTKADNSTPQYVVAVDALGTWARGALVHANELPLTGDGKVDEDNIARLLDLGALVAHADAPAAETMTLAAAVRTDSPPTLPVVPAAVATSPQEVAVAVDPANTTVTGALPR